LQHPENPIALAETALERVQEGDVRTGIGFLQSAIEASGDQLSERVYAAIGAMGELLVMGHQVLPARAHLMLQLGLSGGNDQRPLEILMRLEATPNVSVLVKDTPAYGDAPPDAPWRQEFEEAARLAARGWWRAAAARWENLAASEGDLPEVLRSLATVRGNLGDIEGTVEALRRYASLADDGRLAGSAGASPSRGGVSLEDAVEAEARAQLLDRDSAEGTIDSLLVTFAVNDIEELERRLASDKQLDRMAIDPRALAEDESPPPRAVYWLLDRPLVSSGPELPADQIPQILGQVLLFAKQTDREARLELDLNRPQFPAAREALRKIAGDALGTEQSEQVTGQLSAAQFAMSWQWRLPSDMTEAHRRKLIASERRELVLSRWPNLPLPLFDGQTPAQAAADPANRVRLLGAILLLETSDADSSMTEAYDELRRKLGLPLPEPFDPTGQDVRRVSLVRLTRVEVEKLSDDQIRDAFHRLVGAGYRPAIKRVAKELSRRTNPELLEYKLAAYGALAQGEEDTDRSLELVETARKLAEASRRSTARWDLEELNLRIQRQEGQRVAQLITHLRDEHGREPGVAEALAQVFMQLGLIGPDGRVHMPAEAPAAPGIVVPGAEAAAGKLWTPDSGAPAGQKSSGLWVPE
jgi:hypothetical protein